MTKNHHRQPRPCRSPSAIAVEARGAQLMPRGSLEVASGRGLRAREMYETYISDEYNEGGLR